MAPRQRGRVDGGCVSVEIEPTELPSEAVIRAVATATERDPLELPVLYETVDADALDGLFRRPTHSTEVDRPVLSLSYGGCAVRIDGETVFVEDTECERSA